MTDTKISGLTDGVTAVGTDRIPAARSPFGPTDNVYFTPAYLFTYLKTVDGAGSGLDADLLDGLSSAAFALAAHTHVAADVTDFTEASQDVIGALLITAGDLTWTYNDGANTLSAVITANAVTYAKMQDISATKRVLGRNTAAAGDTEEVTATQVLDWIGTTRGSVLYRGAASWTELTPGTSGHVLTSNGAGADPSYQAAPAASGPSMGKLVAIGQLGCVMP